MDVYSFPFGYRNLTLNGHRSAAGALIEANLGNSIRVDRFDFSRIQQQDQRESFHLITGGDLGDATAAFRFLSVAGSIVASSGAKLDDWISQLFSTFDVEECQIASPSTNGVLPFTFYGVTETVTGRGASFTDPVTGLVAGEFLKERFLARPSGFPIITQRRSGGDTALFALELACPDPRRYIDTAESVVANAGNGYSATAFNWSAALGKALRPLITVVMSGNGASNLTIAIAGGGGPLVLNMSAAGAGTWVIDTATGLITKAGVHQASLRTSAVDSFPFLKAGSSLVTVTNTTNVTSVTLDYRQARG